MKYDTIAKAVKGSAFADPVEENLLKPSKNIGKYDPRFKLISIQIKEHNFLICLVFSGGAKAPPFPGKTNRSEYKSLGVDFPNLWG